MYDDEIIRKIKHPPTKPSNPSMKFDKLMIAVPDIMIKLNRKLVFNLINQKL